MTEDSENSRKTWFGKLQRTRRNRWKREEFEELEYEPTSVKELLTEMKDISELIIDLAYGAVLFDSDEIAEEVKLLDVRMDKLNYDIRMMAMMAARTKEDAEQLAGILQIAEAAESISNAAGDIAGMLAFEEKTRPILPKILSKADERIYHVEVDRKSEACGMKIGDLDIESETGMRVIAIRRGKCWIYNPDSDNIIKEDDWLIVRGNEEGYAELRAFLKGKVEVLE